MALEQLGRQDYIDTIRRDGFVTLDFGVPTEVTRQFFGNFRLLIDEVWDNPTSEAARIVAAFDVTTPGAGDAGQGYILRRRVGEANPFEKRPTLGTEDKDTIHYLPTTAEHVKSYFGGVKSNIPALVRTILNNCADIHHGLVEGMRPMLQAFKMEDWFLSDDPGKNVHIIRGLHYPASAGKIITPGSTEFRAHKHFDRSVWTGALDEDSEGLHGAPGNNLRGNPDMTLAEARLVDEAMAASPISYEENKIKAFAGSRYNYLPEELLETSGRLPLLAHYAANYDPTKPRHVAVGFMHPVVDRVIGEPEDEKERDFNLMLKYLAGQALKPSLV